MNAILFSMKTHPIDWVILTVTFLFCAVVILTRKKNAKLGVTIFKITVLLEVLLTLMLFNSLRGIARTMPALAVEQLSLAYLGLITVISLIGVFALLAVAFSVEVRLWLIQVLENPKSSIVFVVLFALYLVFMAISAVMYISLMI